ncbi:uncharacterized protein LOC128241920 isoform X2 [Mya arenaria]|uniref:uncharacterized protein LOC128241920 isoform X2 n=1 Tax=Mya arenaria TaxID=6604 RepID=UPI0022DF55BA|nr:uncharacterized protein LOC128241920 isoform X2 [Mya arenaria]XP_052815012.1 uncharacterized protein LOC128241920 isoform X2 [Mya arenaria]XP_052815014.1 uncharacterized protein LOC128241920 isoform X2 [Mya arenaria]
MEALQRNIGSPRMRLKPLPLFNKQEVENYVSMKREDMFSYNLRELVLPPIKGAKAFDTARDERLMERAGVGARSARSLPWVENEKEAFQHHAEYLKRLSKLREELIQQEQSNLANALDRLKMRSYGREYVYSQPQREKKAKLRFSAQQENNPAKRNTLITTFEKFQRMRPKREPPTIMPLEGKSLIDTPPVTDRIDRHEKRGGGLYNGNDTSSERSVDENVRLNLQRLTSHPIPSIPRQRRNINRDLVLESSSIRRHSHPTPHDANNSNVAEERIAIMQRQKQKLLKLRHEARETEKLKLMPQSFRLDTLSDDDKMNLDKLKDYYCIYYVPGPPASPSDSENELHVHLPRIGVSSPCNHFENEAALTERSKNGKTVGFRIATDNFVPPTACNCNCRMYVAGNRVESSFDQTLIDESIFKTQEANAAEPGGQYVNIARKSTMSTSRTSSRNTEKSWSQRNSPGKKKSPTGSSEKMRIHVDMPAIVYNTVHSPEPTENTTGLVKAFKQKELRHREYCNLMEDVRELNKISETLSGGGPV